MDDDPTQLDFIATQQPKQNNQNLEIIGSSKLFHNPVKIVMNITDSEEIFAVDSYPGKEGSIE